MPTTSGEPGGGFGHFMETCRVCGTVIAQCRCNSQNKIRRVGVCAKCKASSPDRVQMDLSVADVHVAGAIAEDEPDDKSPDAGDLKPASIVIVQDAGGHVACVSRPEPPHEMALPGGHQEAGETAEQAAARELFEETGLRATRLAPVATIKSPVDGRTVHVFRALEWSGNGYAAESDTRFEWLQPTVLEAQSVLYRSTVRSLMATLTSPQLQLSISAEKRGSLPEGKFALPAQRKYPIDTAARTRNAAARLEQMKKRGKISDADYKAAKGRIARAAKKFGIESQYNESDGRGDSTPSALHIRAEGLARGGSLHVRHMSVSDDGRQAVVRLDDGALGLRDVRRIAQGIEVAPADAGVTLVGPDTWADGSPKKLIWVQLAETGAWKGHQAGPFEMTSVTFSQIIQNFESRRLPVPFDYEHASEQPSTEGSVPQGGSPAPGWVHKLDNRGPAGLWGLVEWLDKARAQIQAGEYAFLSPAIRFGSKDPRSGMPIGARLTSVALTNQPFLTGLEQLRAAKDAGSSVVPAILSAVWFSDGGVRMSALDRKVHDPAAVMPRLKTALKLDPLTSAQGTRDKLDMLRDACMSAGPDGMYCGENLHDYMTPLSELAAQPLGAEWEDVLDALDEFVDAEIEKHVYSGVSMPDGPGALATDDTNDDDQETPMSDQIAVALKDAQAKAQDLEAKLGEKTAEVTALTEKVGARDTVITAKDAEITGLNEKLAARDAVITAKDAELEVVKKTCDDQAKVLKDHADAEEKRIVSERFASYKDKTQMGEEAFFAIFRSDRALFDKTFPPVDPDKRHLLHALTTVMPPGAVQPPAAPLVTMSFTELTRKLQADAKAAGSPISLADAQAQASEILRGRR